MKSQGCSSVMKREGSVSGGPWLTCCSWLFYFSLQRWPVVLHLPLLAWHTLQAAISAVSQEDAKWEIAHKISFLRPKILGKMIVIEASHYELHLGHPSHRALSTNVPLSSLEWPPLLPEKVCSRLCVVWCFKFHQKSKTCKHTDSNQLRDVRNSQMNNKCRERKARPNGLMFFTTVEGLNPLVSNHMAYWTRAGRGWEVLGGRPWKHKRKAFCFLVCAFFLLNIYFLCFARTQFPSHMQNKLFLQMGAGAGRGPVIAYWFCHIQVAGFPHQSGSEQNPATILMSWFGGSWKKGPPFAGAQAHTHMVRCASKRRKLVGSWKRHAGGRWSLPVRSEAVGGQGRVSKPRWQRTEALAWRLLMGHLSQRGRRVAMG